MSDLTRLPLDELLEAVAEATPAPGGGASAALTAALGAALVEMAAGIGGQRAEAARARELRAVALELAEAEVGSYAPVLEARRLPEPERTAALPRALVRASETPLAIAETAAETVELALRVAAASGAAVGADARAGALLAEAATTAAAALVEENLDGTAAGAEQLERARAARERAGAARG